MNNVTDFFDDERRFVARGSKSDEICVNQRANTTKSSKRECHSCDAQSLDYETLESSASVVFIGADVAEFGSVVGLEW